jgi:hypothetical protein
MRLPGLSDQGSKHHCRSARVVQGGVSRRHIKAELLHQAGQPGGLSLGEVEDEAGQGGGVDDRVLERALEPTAHEPAVERVVAVLDQDSALRKAQKRPAGVAELWRADQHRTVDVMALLGIGIDWCSAVNKRVEEGKRARQLESLGAELKDQERSVAGGLDIDGDELGIVHRRSRAQLRGIDRDLLPRHRFRSSAGLEEDRLHDGRLSAVRRNCISSGVIALRRTTAAA